jgi:hypothetical protein
MTAKEALYLIDVQLAHTEQNLQAIKVLSDIVSIVDNIRIDDAYGTEAHPHNMGYDEPETLEHLFGDAQYDIDKLKLIDDETAYQLYGTEAEHFKNHMAKVAERDLQKYKTDEEDTQSETSLNHMFGNVFEQLDNLKLKKKGEK